MNLLKLTIWGLWATIAGYFLFTYVFRDWLIRLTILDISNGSANLFFYIICSAIALIPAFILKYKLQDMRYQKEEKIRKLIIKAGINLFDVGLGDFSTLSNNNYAEEIEKYKEEIKEYCANQMQSYFESYFEFESQMNLRRAEQEKQLALEKEQQEHEYQRQEEDFRKTQRQRKKKELQQEVEHLTDLLCNDSGNQTEVERKLKSAIDSLELLKKANKNRRSWWEL